MIVDKACANACLQVTSWEDGRRQCRSGCRVAKRCEFCGGTCVIDYVNGAGERVQGGKCSVCIEVADPADNAAE
jgi:hypothetical protein